MSEENKNFYKNLKQLLDDTSSWPSEYIYKFIYSSKPENIEILRDIKNYELEFRIAELESKFSKDLSEATFNELKELKKQQKIN